MSTTRLSQASNLSPLSPRLRELWFALGILLLAAVAAPAQTFTNLASFAGTNGANPQLGAVAQGTDGNFYGTTHNGGTSSAGTVFKLTPAGKITAVYNFCSLTSCTDGSNPNGGLVLGTDGNFYGVTELGGANNLGTVFKITTAGKLSTLHSFTGTDGEIPQAPLIQAANGNFYGSTLAGGTGISNSGTVFQITSRGVFTSLYTFCPSGVPCTDGSAPSGLVQGTDGNLYGTTYGGGPSGCFGGGAAWKVTTTGKLTVLHSFCGADGIGGYYPNARLVLGANGNFYGTTAAGGSNGVSEQGTIFELTSTGTLTTLYSFCLQSGCPDGSNPLALILATDGNFYGTTLYDGAFGHGSVFEFTTAGVLTTLHSFNSTDGATPFGTLLEATNGTLYGSTYTGGNSNQGTVYSVANSLPAFVQTLAPSAKVAGAVTIYGLNLTGATAVSFNGTAATFTATNSKITTTVPSGATTGPISVTTPSAVLSTRTSFLVTPQLLSFTPTSGPVGTVVTITGVSLTQASKVTFNGKSAAFTVNSDTQITATVPTGATTGKIVITTAGGTATSTTTFTVH